MNTGKGLLAIIVVSYKSDEMTIDFVRNEVAKVKYPHKVIIVNNAAVEGSTNHIAEALNGKAVYNREVKNEDSDVYVIHNPKDVGFANGNNIGAEFLKIHFDSSYVLFANNDIKIVSEDVCEKLIEKLEEKPDVGLIGPEIIGFEGERQSPSPERSFEESFVLKQLFKPFSHTQWYKKHYSENYTTLVPEGYYPKIMGSFFMLRTNDYFRCGMMDPRTFLYYEERILSAKLKELGLRTYFLPSVKVLHAHCATTSKYYTILNSAKHNIQSGRIYYKYYRDVPEWRLKLGFSLYYFYWKLIFYKKRYFDKRCN